jgi:fatty-acyl-CoA synthase
VYLWTLPMFHCNGWCFTWGVTAAHGKHVCLRKVDPPLVWDLLDRERVTHMCGAPTVMVMLAADDAARPLEVPVRYATGGAPPPPALIERAQALGFDIVHVYGLTETYGPVTVCDWKTEWDALEPGEQARLKARQGVGHVTSDFVRVVDPETMRDVPSDGDTMGEVVMRGNIVMKGYFDDPAATADVFRGGWFHSGDLGVMHPDGYIELRDRAKDIIISGGENISTIEVEQALVRHPDVLEAAVVAIPDEKWGERPKGFVTLRDGAELTEAELIAFTRGSLPGFKAPSEIEFGELPKTSTGKVKKFELRERERARRSAPA